MRTLLLVALFAATCLTSASAQRLLALDGFGFVIDELQPPIAATGFAPSPPLGPIYPPPPPIGFPVGPFSSDSNL